MKSSRNTGFDILRILAIFTVVMIHTASADIAYHGWWMKWLPPANACFAFLSGWFMLPEEKSFGYALRKRVLRLLIPYLVWETIYVLADFAFDLATHKFVIPNAKAWLEIVFLASGSVQLWFVITLFYVQVVFLFLMRVLKIDGWRNVFVWGVIAAALLIWRDGGISSDYVRRFVFLGGFVALGIVTRFFVDACSRAWKHDVRLIGCLVGFVLVLTSMFAHIPYVVCVLAWCATFGCLPFQSVPSIVTRAADCVMGVYLCHVLFTRALGLALPYAAKIITNGYVLLLVDAFVAFALSMIAAMSLGYLRSTRLNRQ